MKAYDARTGMVYRHMARQADRFCIPATSMPSINQLPRRYSNGSGQIVADISPATSAKWGS